MFQVKAKLLYNKRVKESYFHCALNIPKIAENALPGQFVNMKLNDSCDPLLRRPFSIHRVKGREVEILYQVVGKGTEILAQRKPGDCLLYTSPSPRD